MPGLRADPDPTYLTLELVDCADFDIPQFQILVE